MMLKDKGVCRKLRNDRTGSECKICHTFQRKKMLKKRRKTVLAVTSPSSKVLQK